jgi:adenine C2-methylase RlmN of 23S rRNA A2503 and tRNA A37
VAHYQGLPATLKTADTVHWNFMARGEPFDNLDVLGKADDILDILRLKGDLVGLRSRFKISTIGPSNLQGVEFSDLFRKHTPDLYYSLYSMSEKFRRRWLPKAIDPKLMLRKLVSWQQQTMKLVKLHWCFIAGQNDRTQDIVDIADAVNDVGLRAYINIVRYNPFSAAQGEESSESTILACVDILRKILPGSRIKVVSRVGFDVHASCGMFVDNPINI